MCCVAFWEADNTHCDKGPTFTSPNLPSSPPPLPRQALQFLLCILMLEVSPLLNTYNQTGTEAYVAIWQ